MYLDLSAFAIFTIYLDFHCIFFSSKGGLNSVDNDSRNESPSLHSSLEGGGAPFSSL